MNNRDIKKYIDFNPNSGYPAGEKVFFECLECGDNMHSLPSDNMMCKCRNIRIDVDYGRISVKDHLKMKAYYKEV